MTVPARAPHPGLMSATINDTKALITDAPSGADASVDFSHAEQRRLGAVRGRARRGGPSFARVSCVEPEGSLGPRARIFSEDGPASSPYWSQWSSSSNMSRASCAPPLSSPAGEHVLPTWLLKLFSADAAPYRTYLDGQPALDRDGERRNHSSALRVPGSDVRGAQLGAASALRGPCETDRATRSFETNGAMVLSPAEAWTVGDLVREDVVAPSASQSGVFAPRVLRISVVPGR